MRPGDSACPELPSGLRWLNLLPSRISPGSFVLLIFATLIRAGLFARLPAVRTQSMPGPCVGLPGATH